jgi:RNA polymerase sigma factor (sigma-70 family)
MGPIVGREGDAKAKFAAVVVPYLADALAFAHWLTRDGADAEDVVQDACLRAYRAIDGFSGGDPRAWVLAIVRNTAFTWMKKHRPTHLVSVEDLDAVSRSMIEPR